MERVELLISFLEGEYNNLGNVIKKIKEGKNDTLDDDDREILAPFFEKFKNFEDNLDNDGK